MCSIQVVLWQASVWYYLYCYSSFFLSEQLFEMEAALMRQPYIIYIAGILVHYIVVFVCVCVQYGGILVHCVVHENYVRITFKHYTPGSAPALIVNHTKLSVIDYWQRYTFVMGQLLRLIQ